ncbi:MAG: LamG domain-containing protein [Planctomycetes bacterium]|nr:LamG domain-containing protein [Planctomycetota bacterium]
MLTAWDREAGGDPARKILFVEPTPADGTEVPDTSVEIQALITVADLREVKFDWKVTTYTLYDDSLVLMFNFDNIAALGEDYTAGGLVKDISGAGNDGYLYSSPGVPQWIPNGKYGGAFDFTGNGINSGQSILVYHSDSLNPSSGDFAIVVWIFTRDDYDGDVLRKGSTNTAGTWYKLEHAPSSDNNRLSLNFNTDGTDATVNSTKAYNDNQWHFVVAQRRGNRAELWIDGAKDGSKSISGNISNTANLAVGSKDTQNDDFINSALDEVRIYMRSFGADEITELYYSNLSRYDIDKWDLYVNQSNLTNGTYTYQASALQGRKIRSTEQRYITVVRQCPYLGNANPVVNLVDFSMLAYEWQQWGPELQSDLNGDQIVDIQDLAIALLYWLSDCNQL